MVVFLGFLLLGALRAVGLLRWQVAQLEATTPGRLWRSGLRPGKKAPEFTLPRIAGGEVGLQHYTGHKLLLVFMQPGCGPCHDIVPELNRLKDAGEVQVLVIHGGEIEDVRKWIKQNRPNFSVAVQERFNLSKRYEVFATPFAFLINERGVIAARGIVSTKQYRGFVLAGAGHDDSGGDSGIKAFQAYSRTERALNGVVQLGQSSFRMIRKTGEPLETDAEFCELIFGLVGEICGSLIRSNGGREIDSRSREPDAG